MKVLAESSKYQILNEYEYVFLKIKKDSRLINIGDFYGEPQFALISEEEEYCAVGGAGLIIYYLTEPFVEYTYNIECSQWREWGRGNANDTIWVNNIVRVDNNCIEIETEDMQNIILNVRI